MNMFARCSVHTTNHFLRRLRGFCVFRYSLDSSNLPSDKVAIRSGVQTNGRVAFLTMLAALYLNPAGSGNSKRRPRLNTLSRRGTSKKERRHEHETTRKTSRSLAF